MAAVSELAVRLIPDLDQWQRALLQALWSTDRLALSLHRARRVMDGTGHRLVFDLTLEPISRCELAAQRRVDQAMRLRARRAARRTRRATARAMRAGSS